MYKVKTTIDRGGNFKLSSGPNMPTTTTANTDSNVKVALRSFTVIDPVLGLAA
jgi:hypothetical protein